MSGSYQVLCLTQCREPNIVELMPCCPVVQVVVKSWAMALTSRLHCSEVITGYAKKIMHYKEMLWCSAQVHELHGFPTQALHSTMPPWNNLGLQTG